MRQSLDNPNSCSNQMIWPSEPGHSHCKRRSPYSTRPFQGSSGCAPASGFFSLLLLFKPYSHEFAHHLTVLSPQECIAVAVDWYVGPTRVKTMSADQLD